MMYGIESSLTPEELRRLSGSDPVVSFLLSLQMPLTRENYLHYALSEGQSEPDAEIEETIPMELREPLYSKLLKQAQSRSTMKASASPSESAMKPDTTQEL
jgi:hypothetical protein